ncbi:DUF1488 domain-containing protein [Ochrobactrum pecoris]|uniref:DUF1488 domain-containing protein n=1 Tax=Brucella pecoris TaxID=867683 RepID=A0A5C5CE27_9HYPH|nr:DUF1488 domain-containing protein [Brucella pecoris]MBB4095998.1 hypothetical protein [Brucella pecoris]NKW81506.1 DUF1488 domain-containing protein [Brucella pecoris]TNV09016.1 DUF1488 domain-containing protein [Brucella pecoris]
MPLSFPNPSRSFDDFEVGVRFVGYDGMTSVPFLIDKTALEKNGVIAATELSLLTAFDASRKLIYDVAREVYSQTRQTSYRITVEDMK